MERPAARLEKDRASERFSGKKAGDCGFLELQRLFERDGQTVKIKIRRNCRVREIDLTLRRII
jgi:hypothetical protein